MGIYLTPETTFDHKMSTGETVKLKTMTGRVYMRYMMMVQQKEYDNLYDLLPSIVESGVTDSELLTPDALLEILTASKEQSEIGEAQKGKS